MRQVWCIFFIQKTGDLTFIIRRTYIIIIMDFKDAGDSPSEKAIISRINALKSQLRSLKRRYTPSSTEIRCGDCNMLLTGKITLEVHFEDGIRCGDCYEIYRLLRKNKATVIRDNIAYAIEKKRYKPLLIRLPDKKALLFTDHTDKEYVHTIEKILAYKDYTVIKLKTMKILLYPDNKHVIRDTIKTIKEMADNLERYISQLESKYRASPKNIYVRKDKKSTRVRVQVVNDMTISMEVDPLSENPSSSDLPESLKKLIREKKTMEKVIEELSGS